MTAASNFRDVVELLQERGWKNTLVAHCTLALKATPAAARTGIERNWRERDSSPPYTNLGQSSKFRRES